MNDCMTLSKGKLPILVSMPHNGTEIPTDIADNMTASALKVVDTDWHLDQLYDFAEKLGCSTLIPRYSRYVIDLNRPKDDQNLYPGADTTGLCPSTQFDRQPVYMEGYQVSEKEQKRRVKCYWQPYHDCLAAELIRIKKQFGRAILFEAHSIKSVVPRFFEGELPDFNFGNFDGKSSSTQLLQLVNKWQPIGYTKVVNERFKGGYITRHYGQPTDKVDSLQLELSQATYMDETLLIYNNDKAEQVKEQLQKLFENLIDYSRISS